MVLVEFRNELLLEIADYIREFRDLSNNVATAGARS